ncbi:MAG: hypothetical protein JWM27_2250 [Gemmatimonadetes bacterium]|nr:hypothetical protein [Gemmatimonadota bacterium]
MPEDSPVRAPAARGAARLLVDATVGVTDLVEAVHDGIARPVRLPGGRAKGRTRGITGLVYRGIRRAALLAGGGVDGALARLGPALHGPPSPLREALVAALNGVLGDHLAATENPLAITPRLRHAGRPLRLHPDALAAALPAANGRVLVMVHGVCMSDVQWLRGGHDHGAALARDRGYTVIHPHYNSGLHISVNGRTLARLLERAVGAWPVPVREVAIVGHSMGGLVARAACRTAEEEGHAWKGRLTKLVCLGTPHHGAPLERGGNWVDAILEAVPYAAPFARLGRIRSAGISDLRYGNVAREDWAGRDRFRLGRDGRTPVPLPAGVQCFAAAATVAAAPGSLRDQMVGDGLVPLDSALGRHPDPERTLGFAEDRQYVARGMHHMDLLSHPAVYARLRDWL